jgi:hypothetical protein
MNGQEQPGRKATGKTKEEVRQARAAEALADVRRRSECAHGPRPQKGKKA